jgi:hypothetical protein
MTWQFCDNERCPDNWHWTDLAGAPEACRASDEQENQEGVVRSYFAA